MASVETFNYSSPSGALKRPRKVDNWKRNVAKRQRNLGIEYTSLNSGKPVAARKIGQECGCKMKCFDKVVEESRIRIFKDFWASGKRDTHVAFVHSHVVEHPIKRHRTKDEGKRRHCTREYFLDTDGGRVAVCKKAFSSILAISINTIDFWMKSKTSSGVQKAEGRGKHNNHPRVPPTDQELVLQHIASLPKVTSHYSRKSAPLARYLDTDLGSKRDMYLLYRTWLQENHPGMTPVKLHYYRDCQ